MLYWGPGGLKRGPTLENDPNRALNPKPGFLTLTLNLELTPPAPTRACSSELRPRWTLALGSAAVVWNAQLPAFVRRDQSYCWHQRH